jgi:molybdopterin/thiamine biosynthesis adenylyltransferase
MNLDEIIFTASQWAALQDHLFGRTEPVSPATCDEQMAFVLAGPSASSRGSRLIVRELVPAGRADLSHQSPAGIGPTGEFVAAALTRCVQEGWSLIEVHSHPFDHGASTTFSGIDWDNDRAKMPVLARLLPEHAHHATMVVGRSSLDAHCYDRTTSSIQPVRRISILGAQDEGRWLTHISPTQATEDDAHPFLDEDRYSRQILLFGREAQALLARATIAVVGLGGLGSFVVLQLAHLGVGSLVLIDPDAVETTNLNRLMGATERDVGRPKVDLYQSLISAISPGCRVKHVPASILSDEALREAKQADLLMGCVDNHGARLVINQLAVQYLIPLVDGATGVRRDERKHVTHAGGEVQVVLPGLGCLYCREFIDPEQAARDLAPTHVRQREHDHGYGTNEPAPAVVFLNGVIASVQVAEAVRLLSGENDSDEVSPIAMYDMLGQSLRRTTWKETGSCPICGPGGDVGLADLSPLYAADTVSVPEPISLGSSEH